MLQQQQQQQQHQRPFAPPAPFQQQQQQQPQQLQLPPPLAAAVVLPSMVTASLSTGTAGTALAGAPQLPLPQQPHSLAMHHLNANDSRANLHLQQHNLHQQQQQQQNFLQQSRGQQHFQQSPHQLAALNLYQLQRTVPGMVPALSMNAGPPAPAQAFFGAVPDSQLPAHVHKTMLEPVPGLTRMHGPLFEEMERQQIAHMNLMKQQQAILSQQIAALQHEMARVDFKQLELHQAIQRQQHHEMSQQLSGIQPPLPVGQGGAPMGPVAAHGLATVLPAPALSSLGRSKSHSVLSAAAVSSIVDSYAFGNENLADDGGTGQSAQFQPFPKLDRYLNNRTSSMTRSSALSSAPDSPYASSIAPTLRSAHLSDASTLVSAPSPLHSALSLEYPANRPLSHFSAVQEPVPGSVTLAAAPQGNRVIPPQASNQFSAELNILDSLLLAQSPGRPTTKQMDIVTSMKPNLQHQELSMTQNLPHSHQRYASIPLPPAPQTKRRESPVPPPVITNSPNQKATDPNTMPSANSSLFFKSAPLPPSSPVSVVAASEFRMRTTDHLLDSDASGIQYRRSSEPNVHYAQHQPRELLHRHQQPSPAHSIQHHGPMHSPSPHSSQPSQGRLSLHSPSISSQLSAPASHRVPSLTLAPRSTPAQLDTESQPPSPPPRDASQQQQQRAAVAFSDLIAKPDLHLIGCLFARPHPSAADFRPHTVAIWSGKLFVFANAYPTHEQRPLACLHVQDAAAAAASSAGEANSAATAAPAVINVDSDPAVARFTVRAVDDAVTAVAADVPGTTTATTAQPAPTTTTAAWEFQADTRDTMKTWLDRLGYQAPATAAAERAESPEDDTLPRRRAGKSDKNKAAEILGLAGAAAVVAGLVGGGSGGSSSSSIRTPAMSAVVDATAAVAAVPAAAPSSNSQMFPVRMDSRLPGAIPGATSVDATARGPTTQLKRSDSTASAPGSRRGAAGSALKDSTGVSDDDDDQDDDIRRSKRSNAKAAQLLGLAPAAEPASGVGGVGGVGSSRKAAALLGLSVDAGGTSAGGGGSARRRGSSFEVQRNEAPDEVHLLRGRPRAFTKGAGGMSGLLGKAKMALMSEAAAGVFSAAGGGGGGGVGGSRSRSVVARDVGVRNQGGGEVGGGNPAATTSLSSSLSSSTSWKTKPLPVPVGSEDLEKTWAGMFAT